MANIKTTTQTNTIRYALAIFGFGLGVLGLINIFMSMTPTLKNDVVIDTAFEKAQALPPIQRINLFKTLSNEQMQNLAQRPSNPYGWARLSYLRMSTTGDEKAGFAALAISDFISPNEAPQLPERAIMWWRYRNVETKDQQAYQDILWQKAYRLERDATWDAAVRNKLVSVVEVSLKQTDTVLYNEWKNRELNTH